MSIYMKVARMFTAVLVSVAAVASVAETRRAEAAPRSRIAYAETGRGVRGIYTVRPDGTGVRRLTNGPDRNPTWSPDGTKIAFVRFDGGRDYSHALMVMNADGTEERRVAPVATWRVHDFDWSPDSTRIAYGAHVHDDEDDLFVVDVATRERRRLVNVAEAEWNPRWSPAGDEILFVAPYATDEPTRTDVYKIAAPDESPGPVPTPSPSPTPIAQSTGEDHSAEWSPDGTQVAFASSRDHQVEEHVAEQSNDVYVANADGSDPRRLSESPQMETPIAWKPDGNVVAYVAWCFSHVCDAKPSLRARFVATGNSWLLARRVAVDPFDWSPTGLRLVYVRYDGSDLDLVTVDWLGDERRVLVGGRGNQVDPDWL